MSFISVNGIQLNYRDQGVGEPVVMVMGTGSGGHVWQLYQEPALLAAGYRVITFDNRGIPPSHEGAEGFTVDDLVSDVAALIERLDLGPCRLVGTSMGSYVIQELALARADLIREMVLIATRGRSDAMRAYLTEAEIELAESGTSLPAAYHAVMQAVWYLSPATLANDRQIRDWLGVFEYAPRVSPGTLSQLRLGPPPDRLDKYREIEVPTHVISFADDLITPPDLGEEVAKAIPEATFEVLTDCGHCGYLERPEAVNSSILEFFGDRPTKGRMQARTSPWEKK